MAKLTQTENRDYLNRIIKYIGYKCDMTKVAIAESARITPQHMYMVLAGHTRINDKLAKALARLSGLPLEVVYLAGGVLHGEIKKRALSDSKAFYEKLISEGGDGKAA